MRGSHRVSALACAVFAACSTIYSSSTLADVQYDITALGLMDAGHVRADGYCRSMWVAYNDKGGVIGRSTRWSGNTYMGDSAWFYENKETTRIGLWDAAHRRADGYVFSQVLSVTERQQVLGYSTQYLGAYDGRTAWIYSGGATHVIGLTDSMHTAADGLQNSYGFKQNADGDAIGYSTQYKGTITIGKSAWIYSKGQTIRIGRAGSDAYDSSGASWNDPEYISDGGYVAGWGGRYGATDSYMGHAAWRYVDGQTQDIGLFDAEHTASDGTREGRTMGVNTKGDVIGYASRYSGAAFMGQTAWIDRGGSVTKLGLTGGIHSASSGRHVSAPTKINSKGQVAGWSTQYVGLAEGCSTWFFDGVSSQRIGLSDAEHITSDGTGYSTVVALNDAGTVAGVSQQRLTDGLSAFHYQDGVTTRIGLFDSKHCRDDGWSSNSASRLNAAGGITGGATRTNGYSGATAWYYDPEENHTYALEFSESTSGLASSVVQYLGDEGVCLGTYAYFDGEVNLGDHTFYWSEDKGFHDLGSIAAGGLGAQGWERLYDGIVINGNGDVIIKGKLNTSLQGATLLAGELEFDVGVSALGDQAGQYDALANVSVWGDVPVMLTAVPEPTSLAYLAGVGCLLCLRVRGGSGGYGGRRSGALPGSA